MWLWLDWQTIPYDPCTEYSPFHHPGHSITHQNSSYEDGTSFQNSSFLELSLQEAHNYTIHMHRFSQGTLSISPKLASIHNVLSDIDIETKPPVLTWVWAFLVNKWKAVIVLSYHQGVWDFLWTMLGWHPLTLALKQTQPWNSLSALLPSIRNIPSHSAFA